MVPAYQSAWAPRPQRTAATRHPRRAHRWSAPEHQHLDQSRARWPSPGVGSTDRLHAQPGCWSDRCS